MSTGNSSSYIHDADQNRQVLNSLFTFSNNTRTLKPYSKRNLPDSFYRPPNVAPKSKQVHRRHTKSQSNSSENILQSSSSHLRAASDSEILTEQSMKKSQSTLLPLPDDWEEKQTDDGQIFYIDHRNKSTTWIDPRPKHYAAFQTFCSTLPLPDGFEQTYDTQGNSYFINHETKQTYWEDPRMNFYRSLMTKRLDVPSQSSKDLLSNRLIEISKERHELQIRTQELQRMEADIRKRIEQQDQTEFESLINDLLVLKRQDSTDSGLDDGRCNNTPINDRFKSNDFSLPNKSNFSTFPDVNDSMLQNLSDDHQIFTTDF